MRDRSAIKASSKITALFVNLSIQTAVGNRPQKCSRSNARFLYEINYFFFSIDCQLTKNGSWLTVGNIVVGLQI